MSKVVVRIDPTWSERTEQDLYKGMLNLVTDIDTRSAQIAPVLTGALVNSRKIEDKGNGEFELSYGSSKVPYARRRYYENRLHPDSTEWLEKAADSVARSDKEKYFK